MARAWLLAVLACGGQAASLEREGSAENRPSPTAEPRSTPPGGSVGSAAPAPSLGPSAPAVMPPAMTPPQPPTMLPPPPTSSEPDAPGLPEPPTAPGPVASPCASVEPVVVFLQSEVAALAGCEALFGLRVFGPLDLRPLAALRSIGEGGLEVNNSSLEGLEGLEEASRLYLSGSSVQSLLPLAGLRRLGALTSRA